MLGDDTPTNKILTDMTNVKVKRIKYMGKSVDYSTMVGRVFKVFKETPSTYVLFSNPDYRFTTTVSKRDCEKTNKPTITYNW